MGDKRSGMKQRIIQILKGFTPPIAHDLFHILSGRVNGFSGNYQTWDEARRASDGYDSEVILDKVKEALLKVKKGEAVYERDSVLFNDVEYSWPLLAGLLWVASRNKNRLNLVDFGGSLGSTYYQNIKLLTQLDELKWSIVEQENYVECGKQSFENDCLKFYYDLEECIVERHPDTILFSSVIQYLEKPYELLADAVGRGFTFLIFDRTSFLEKGDDRITVQKVPPEIYPASYPAWFFNRGKFLSFFSGTYDLITEFDSFESFRLEDQTFQNKGFIFVKK
jgi:putative methyltransferase (TIGR04325 family)